MKKYLGFTLVEVLVVMGIIVILAAIGIVAGRYAIQRANRIDHQNAVENLYASLLSFKNDNGFYPQIGYCTNCVEEQFFAEALGYKGTKDLLKGYVEKDFDGGNDATYYYYVDPVAAQFVVLCVSLGGIDDESNLGFYCSGDGLGFLPETSPLVGKNFGSGLDDPTNVSIINSFDQSDWRKDSGFSVSN